MSALWTHIRVLRAEAKALEKEADKLRAVGESVPAHVMLGLSYAKAEAADELEAGQNELLERITGAAKEA